MDTLYELRKVGGFSDIEELRDNSRAHPSLLLDIIETMILAKTDMKNPVLLAKLNDNDKNFNEILKQSLSVLDVNNNLALEIKRTEEFIKYVKKFYIGLNFILARSGRLKNVRIDMISHSIPIDGGNDSMDSTNAQMYYNQVENLRKQMNSLLKMIDICAISSDEIVQIPDPPNLKIYEEKPLQSTTPLDNYLQRSIHAARIVQIVEKYLLSLYVIVKKIYQNIELAYAQCAVLINSRAMIV